MKYLFCFFPFPAASVPDMYINFLICASLSWLLFEILKNNKSVTYTHFQELVYNHVIKLLAVRLSCISIEMSQYPLLESQLWFVLNIWPGGWRQMRAVRASQLTARWGNVPGVHQRWRHLDPASLTVNTGDRRVWLDIEAKTCLDMVSFLLSYCLF